MPFDPLKHTNTTKISGGAKTYAVALAVFLSCGVGVCAWYALTPVPAPAIYVGMTSEDAHSHGANVGSCKKLPVDIDMKDGGVVTIGAVCGGAPFPADAKMKMVPKSGTIRGVGNPFNYFADPFSVEAEAYRKLNPSGLFEIINLEFVVEDYDKDGSKDSFFYTSTEATKGAEFYSSCPSTTRELEVDFSVIHTWVGQRPNFRAMVPVECHTEEGRVKVEKEVEFSAETEDVWSDEEVIKVVNSVCSIAKTAPSRFECEKARSRSASDIFVAVFAMIMTFKAVAEFVALEYDSRLGRGAVVAPTQVEP